MPKNRGECKNGVRPCPYLQCRHNLRTEQKSSRTGKKPPILYVYSKQEYTCALDVADDGGLTLEDVGNLWGITREAVRLIEQRALRKCKVHDRYRNSGRLKKAFADMTERETHRPVTTRRLIYDYGIQKTIPIPCQKTKRMGVNGG